MIYILASILVSFVISSCNKNSGNNIYKEQLDLIEKSEKNRNIFKIKSNVFIFDEKGNKIGEIYKGVEIRDTSDFDMMGVLGDFKGSRFCNLSLIIHDESKIEKTGNLYNSDNVKIYSIK